MIRAKSYANSDLGGRLVIDANAGGRIEASKIIVGAILDRRSAIAKE